MAKRRPRERAPEPDWRDSENTIKTEVIVELRNENRMLLAERQRLLEALVEANEAILIYRKDALRRTTLAIQSAELSHCVAGCTRHEWDSVVGWRRPKRA